ncbi:hypothetical protein IG631_16006 [Alternaria alternata]|nr:hypothetical protein IG631_16006 [Alternaria alternata]
MYCEDPDFKTVFADAGTENMRWPRIWCAPTCNAGGDVQGEHISEMCGNRWPKK